mmetsp:Transcript_14232/g.29119  ORF Transcript_14232/g.29119 Transcript_14232/m.29119 type:complete len:152 (-) Transcript_14232:705-1160(-)
MSALFSPGSWSYWLRVYSKLDEDDRTNWVSFHTNLYPIRDCFTLSPSSLAAAFEDSTRSAMFLRIFLTLGMRRYKGCTSGAKRYRRASMNLSTAHITLHIVFANYPENDNFPCMQWSMQWYPPLKEIIVDDLGHNHDCRLAWRIDQRTGTA